MQIELKASPGDLRLKLCSYIVHTSFTSRTTGLECSHTWVSYRNRSLLVGFDALMRKQRCSVDSTVQTLSEIVSVLCPYIMYVYKCTVMNEVAPALPACMHV